MNSQKVWFITRISKGIGLEAAKAVLADGGKIVVILRSIDEHMLLILY